MKCANCGKEFGNGITCQNCGTDRFTGLGNYHGYSPSVNESVENRSRNDYYNRNTEVSAVCRSCGKTVPADSAFCPYCGKELFVKCPNCGNILSSDFVFCNKCGMKRKTDYMCKVCGYVYKGDHAPEKCPICKASEWDYIF